MTNIVGGSTSNFTQTGASVDSNTLLGSENGSNLDFLQLISVALDHPNGVAASKDSSVSIEGEKLTDSFSLELVNDKSYGSKALVNEKINLISLDNLEGSNDIISLIEGLPLEHEEQETLGQKSLTASNILVRFVPDSKLTETDFAGLKSMISPELLEELNKYSELQTALHNFMHNSKISNFDLSEEPLIQSEEILPNLILDEPKQAENIILESKISQSGSLKQTDDLTEKPNQTISSSILNALSFVQHEDKPILLNLNELEEVKSSNIDYTKLTKIYLNSDISAGKNLNDKTAIEVNLSYDDGLIKVNLKKMGGDNLKVTDQTIQISEILSSELKTNVNEVTLSETNSLPKAETVNAPLSEVRDVSTSDITIFGNDATDITRTKTNIANVNKTNVTNAIEHANTNISGTEIVQSSTEDNKALVFEVPNKNLAILIVNIDASLAKVSLSQEVPITFKLMGEQKLDSVSKMQNLELNDGEEAILRVLQEPRDAIRIINGLGHTKPTLPELNNNSGAETPETSSPVKFRDNGPLTSNLANKDAPKPYQISEIFSDLPNVELPSKEMLEFLREKLKVSNDTLTKELATKNKVINFLKTNELSIPITAAVSKVIKSDFKSFENLSPKKKLLVSTADVIGFRKEVSSSLGKEKIEGNKAVFAYSSNKDLNVKLDNSSLAETNFSSETGSVETINNQLKSINFSPLDPMQNKVSQTSAKMQLSNTATSQARLSVLDAQFSSRLAANLLEQAATSKENFDLILEPENFGKVRVNVSLENLQLDVKLTAENSATLAILRASEQVLQSITELNGLKLAEYNVELNNTLQNNNGSKEQKEQNSKSNANVDQNVENSEDNGESYTDDSSHSLNLMA